MAAPNPGDLASFDQTLAAVSRDLEGILEALRPQVAAFGPEQAIANMALALMRHHNPVRDQNLLLAALYRLSKPASAEY